MSTEILDSKIFTNKSIRPNSDRARYAQMLIWACLIIDVVSIGSSYMQFNLLNAAKNNEIITMEMATSNDTREMIVGFVQVGLMLISSITFIMWFRRAYYNLGQRTQKDYTDGWAAGAWFVPILSLFRPFQIMREMWDKTTRLINKKSDEKESLSIAILSAWWTFWIVSNILGNYNFRATMKDQSLNGMLTGTVIDMIVSLLGIPLAIITVKIIRSYNAKEEKLADLEISESLIVAH